MLHRIMDPASSTRQTPAARIRLTQHPMTTSLLDAGLRLLLHEFAVPDPADLGVAPPIRLFEALTAARVSAAATRTGPLRVTDGHLRDRWPLQQDFVADLLAYGLWELQWSPLLRSVQQVAQQRPRRPGPDDLTAMAAALAELHLYSGRVAVTHRLELLTAALADARPELRAARSRSYAHLDAVYTGVYAELFRRTGYRPVPGTDQSELVVVLGALTEGANLRLMARGDDPAARAAAARTIAVAGELLVRCAWEADDAPDGALPSTAPPVDALEVALEPAPPELVDVLVRLTDPRTGTRRTTAGRRRLAEDALTRQLLDGGIAVLAEEFAVAPRGGAGRARRTGSGGGSRAFDVLSVARVVAEARAGGGVGAGATAGQLRDRWAVQEHYVDDLVSYSLRRRSSVVDALAAGARDGGAERYLAPERAVAAAVEHLQRVRSGTAARLRLLVTTLAVSRPGMAQALVRLDDEERAALARVLQAQLDHAQLELRPGFGAEEVAGWLLALSDGVEVRLLATGEHDVEAAGQLLLRTASALVAACCRPTSAGA